MTSLNPRCSCWRKRGCSEPLKGSLHFFHYMCQSKLTSLYVVKATPCSSFCLWSDQHLLVVFFSCLHSTQTAPKKVGERVLCLLKYSHSDNMWTYSFELRLCYTVIPMDKTKQSLVIFNTYFLTWNQTMVVSFSISCI